MAYQEPKTDWDINYEPDPDDLNRIEGDIKQLKDGSITINGNKTYSGDNTHSGQTTLDDALITLGGNIDNDDNDIENCGAILGRGAAKRIEPAGTFAGGALTSYVNEATVWAAWSALIPVIGQKAIVNGGFKVIGSGANGIIAYIERTSSTRITIHYYTDQSTVYEYYWLDSTDTRNWECALSW